MSERSWLLIVNKLQSSYLETSHSSGVFLLKKSLAFSKKKTYNDSTLIIHKTIMTNLLEKVLEKNSQVKIVRDRERTVISPTEVVMRNPLMMSMDFISQNRHHFEQWSDEMHALNPETHGDTEDYLIDLIFTHTNEIMSNIYSQYIDWKILIKNLNN